MKTNMNFKNVLAVVGISVATTLGSIFAVGKISHKNDGEFIQQSGKLPANYAGFFDNEK